MLGNSIKMQVSLLLFLAGFGKIGGFGKLGKFACPTWILENLMNYYIAPQNKSKCVLSKSLILLLFELK